MDITSVGKQLPKSRRDYFTKLGEKVCDDEKVFDVFEYRLEKAVEMAKKRAKWNYKAAIPIYFPQENRGAMILPLALENDEKADLALVVERYESGSYQGHTVITLEAAYKNARLITRPDSDWLDTATLNPEADDIDE